MSSSLRRHVTLHALCLLLGVTGAACTRSSPPEVPEFRPPRKVVLESPPEPVTEAPAVAEAPAPAPPPSEPVVIPVAAVAASVPAPAAPKPASPGVPSIVGSWTIVESARNGKPDPMPPGATMILTFVEGGTLNMEMTMEGRQNTQSGTYSVSGDQITIGMQNENKTGTLAFEGANRAIISVEETRLTLQRR